jgi:hypothetical protein
MKEKPVWKKYNQKMKPRSITIFIYQRISHKKKLSEQFSSTKKTTDRKNITVDFRFIFNDNEPIG